MIPDNSSEPASTDRHVAAIARGDKGALAALYDEFAGPFYSLAFRLLGNSTEAQDLVQEVFLQLWRTADTWESSRGSVLAWSVTLIRSRASDRIRLRQSRASGAADSPGSLPELANNPELSALVDSGGITVTQLSRIVPQVATPPELRSRILEAAVVPPEAPLIDFPLLRLFPWVLAATLALTATWLAVQNLSLRTINEDLVTERRLADVAYRTSQNQLAERSLLAEGMINDLGARLRRSDDLARLKVLALASLADNTLTTQAIAVWDPHQQTGLLTCDNLPPLAKDRDYQIWIVDPAYPDPVSGGVFQPDADGRVVLAFNPDQPIRQASGFLISLENKGGAPKAAGPLVLSGKVPGN